MHFSTNNNASAGKLGKIGIVTALHLLVGIALVNNLNKTTPGPAQAQAADLVLVKDKPLEPPPPPPPLPPATVVKAVIPPRLAIVPPPEVLVLPPETASPISSTIDTTAPPPNPGPATVTEPAPRPAATAAAMHTAVLADAAGCAKPDYPARAARNGETGTVALALLVGSDGRVADARIQKSSGSRELDRAAITALSMCKFKPATNGGVPEQGWARIAYVWTLDA